MTTQTIRSLDAYSAPTTSSDAFIGLEEAARAPSSAPQKAEIIQLVDYWNRDEQVPARHKPIESLVEKWSADPGRRVALEDARRWLADAFYTAGGDTVRTLRLRKGLSQATLAATIGTSQPHIARIERGTENLMMDTCRRLAAALGIDMNTLDLALRRQESLTRPSESST